MMAKSVRKTFYKTLAFVLNHFPFKRNGGWGLYY